MVVGISNRSYQIRSRRGALVPVGEVLQELVERAADRFYRPAQRPCQKVSGKRDPIKKSGKLQGVQLELFRVEPNTSHFPPSNEGPKLEADPARPLFDLFPEAYV